MGKREETLRSLLEQAGLITRRGLPLVSRSDILKFDRLDLIEHVYKDLGGTLDDVPFRHQGWDIEYEGMAVELDEELHFNDYRLITLRSSLYKQLPAFPLKKYQNYARRYSGECMKCGAYLGKWSKPACERQFGRGARPGDLSGSGSPRWKQRAFYDFIKDLSPILGGVDVARIAIWDRLVDGSGSRTIGEVLDNPARDSASAIAEFIERRRATPSKRMQRTRQGVTRNEKRRTCATLPRRVRR